MFSLVWYGDITIPGEELHNLGRYTHAALMVFAEPQFFRSHLALLPLIENIASYLYTQEDILGETD
jgi:hypothetical protein